MIDDYRIWTDAYDRPVLLVKIDVSMVLFPSQQDRKHPETSAWSDGRSRNLAKRMEILAIDDARRKQSKKQPIPVGKTMARH
jgi:hypothetical protein